MTHDPLDAFVDAEPSTLVLADRSTLERYATCPMQARLMAEINSHSDAANSGLEVHEALSEATRDYMASGGVLSPSEIMEEAANYLRHARPDVQPDTLDGVRRDTLWAWAKFLSGLNPQNIVRYDGGQGSRSGQLAWDLPAVGVRVTTELDLLYAGPSKEVLHEVDYKSGRAVWTASEVHDSFQFQMHAFLVLNNYPDVQAVEIRVWNTRSNRLTWSIEFPRAKLAEYSARVTMAAMTLYQHDRNPDLPVPAWPSLEKCSACPAAALCPVSGRPIKDVEADPQGFVRDMAAVKARLALMESTAKAWIKKHGRDIVCDTGEAFGVDKPKSRAPLASLYTIETDSEDK